MWALKLLSPSAQLSPGVQAPATAGKMPVLCAQATLPQATFGTGRNTEHPFGTAFFAENLYICFSSPCTAMGALGSQQPSMD